MRDTTNEDKQSRPTGDYPTQQFPQLLTDLEINVVSPEFSSGDVGNLYSMISKGYDSGDAMIWLKMQKAGLDTILTDNVSDWKELGAKVIAFG